MNKKQSSQPAMILFRPVGPKGLELIAASGFREFPLRLPGQPIFYPVLNEEYARQIARDWNVPASSAGYVNLFVLQKEFASRYSIRTVGASIHQELWIPAEDLLELNRNIVGLIEVIAEFKPMKKIFFYRITGPYGEFSNFSPHSVELKCRIWPTSEHYFQAQKFSGTEHEEAVRRAKSPMMAARMGCSRERPLRADWEAVKDQLMREAVWAKFNQHAKLRSLLLSTGDAELAEHTVNDRYWGDGGDGTGENRLGNLLMELRNQLRKEG
jgi:ribA/ribD-fused uncharacterized protein